MNKYFKVIVFIAGVMFLASCSAFGGSRIDPGYVGIFIDYTKGTAAHPDMREIPTGQYVTYNPITQYVEEYPIGEQTLTMTRAGKADDSVSCHDKNGIPVSVDSSTFWKVNPAPAEVEALYLLRPKTPLINDSNGDDISTMVVRREVRNAITIGCSNFTYDEIYGQQRVQLQQLISQDLSKQLASFHLLMDSFTLGEIYIDPSQQTFINQKAQAQQQAEAATYSVQLAIAQSSAQVASASGNAQAIRVVGAALNDNPSYVEYQKVQKWDGHNPQVVGSNAGVLVQITSSETSSTSAVTSTESAATSTKK